MGTWAASLTCTMVVTVAYNAISYHCSVGRQAQRVNSVLCSSSAVPVTLMPIAFRRLSSLLLRTAKGRAGLVTRQVSSKKTLPGCRGMPYRKDGTSCWDPHTPSPAAGCSWSFSLHKIYSDSHMNRMLVLFFTSCQKKSNTEAGAWHWLCRTKFVDEKLV